MIAAFAILAALMAGLALAFVLWPLLRHGARGRTVIGAIALAFALPVCALSLYMWIGTPQALSPEAPAAMQQPAGALDMNKAVAQLEAHLEAEPTDIEGWTLLARAQLAMGHPDKATAAWDHAVTLDPDNADLLVASVEARSQADPKHRIDDIAQERLTHALAIQPTHQRGLWLKGIGDYQRGDFADAAATWTRLLPQLDPDSQAEVIKAVQAQIRRAQAEAGS